MWLQGTFDEESESSSDEEISPNEQGRQNSTQLTVGNTTTTSKPNATRRNYHHLPRIHRRILLKQLHTGNRHGRKSYKFRQLQPFQCSVQCDNSYDKPDSGPIMGYPHQSPPADDVDDDSDSYEEGEDTPIEATIRPYVPENIVIGGVKPFGFWPDFMEWDDFGPGGELARDPLFIAEEDKRSKAKGLRKHREKMKIKQEEKKHV
ncbi:hypothetical protein NQ318_005854 [Aromia moschata]|uniref:Uncharacterized protein n=1 Tax=Aromia moschata TaxID=1265417 RepID=A0AAV8YUE3_9CUCU|nr:hypothetical protein NQ318_005854 [Aromia moschata]